ncbi:MAG: TonB-dependent receptor, partial [Candidatus Accumulibacter sp.]|nr:TonB-dependent receptor [Accumulibacter sp.]
TLPTVYVNASADASSEGLAPVYPGGQLARGGRAGILGTRDALETPFSINSYTAELLQNQQARGVGDVLQNDASVQVARGFGYFQESYFVRGFYLGSDDIAYNGLYSLLPRQYIAAELFERVEVLRGASAFLIGAAPGNTGIGGSINLLPKRAPNEPLSRINLGWTQGGQKSVSFDMAHRFGDDQATGLRIVGVRREGDTMVDREQNRLDAFLAGFDWRSGKARFSADLGYQNHRLKGIRPSVTLLPSVTHLPSAPDNRKNYAQDWTYSDERDLFASLRGEYDLSERVTAWIAGGMRKSEEKNSFAGIRIADGFTGAGNANVRLDTSREDEISTGEIGLRGKLRTGAVDHTLVASYSTGQFDVKTAWTYASLTGTTGATNLYHPVQVPRPATTSTGGDWHRPKTTSKTLLSSFAVGDTLSMLDERLLLTLGIRHQTLESKDYNVNTGDRTGGYKDSKNSPMAGLVVRPMRNLSFYANYIESLSRGDTSPRVDSSGAQIKNGGQSLAPYVSKQKEIGVKYEVGTLAASLAYFTTEKPRAFVDADGYFKASGNDRHRGIEFNVQGKATKNLRILGGITWLDARQEKTGSNLTDDKKVIGVASRRANLNVEWDVPGLRGLTLEARAIASSSSYADAPNTLRVPGWSRFDMGARYLTTWRDHLVTIRARIENVGDRDYWASVGGAANSGYLVLGAPRTFMLTGAIEF